MAEATDKTKDSEHGPFRPGFPRAQSLGAAATPTSDEDRLLAEIRYLEKTVEERAKRELGPTAPPTSAYRAFNP